MYFSKTAPLSQVSKPMPYFENQTLIWHGVETPCQQESATYRYSSEIGVFQYVIEFIYYNTIAS